jgi:integrase
MSKTAKKNINHKQKNIVKNILEENLDEEADIDVAHGFDRGIDFNTIKAKLIKEYDDLKSKFSDLDFDDKFYVRRKRMIFHKMIYCIIALIQLRGGSRISEAVSAFKKFITTGNFDNKVLVKIAKSESIKYKKETKEQFKTKARYRKMMFPSDWIEISDEEDLDFYSKVIPNKKLQKRVLDYLLQYFDCNTHSLRYAFINHMLYDQKKEMSLVARFVGHTNVQQLVTYTQQKQTDKMFDMDI